jgi:hypothetical protein
MRPHPRDGGALRRPVFAFRAFSRLPDPRHPSTAPAMPRVRRPRRLSLLAVSAAVACTSGPTDLCGCSIPLPSALLYGRVTDAAGAPVHDARVMAEAGGPGCAPPLETLGEARTAADGSYRAVLTVYVRVPRPGDCLRASATPPAGSALRGSDSVAFATRFGHHPLDSARVDLVLRAP